MDKERRSGERFGAAGGAGAGVGGVSDSRAIASPKTVQSSGASEDEASLRMPDATRWSVEARGLRCCCCCCCMSAGAAARVEEGWRNDNPGRAVAWWEGEDGRRRLCAGEARGEGFDS